jgi:uncharacterized protein (AIM24 family)
MRYQISGNVMQTVAIDLSPGETVYSQTNTMCWMNDAVTMDTHTGGGFLAGLKRSRRASPARSCPRCCIPASR